MHHPFGWFLGKKGLIWGWIIWRRGEIKMVWKRGVKRRLLFAQESVFIVSVPTTKPCRSAWTAACCRLRIMSLFIIERRWNLMGCSEIISFSAILWLIKILLAINPPVPEHICFRQTLIRHSNFSGTFSSKIRVFASMLWLARPNGLSNKTDVLGTVQINSNQDDGTITWEDWYI